MGCCSSSSKVKDPQQTKSKNQVVPIKNQDSVEAQYSKQPKETTQQDVQDAQKQNQINHYVPQQKRRIIETVNIKKSKNKEGHKMINNYVLEQELGKGAYGKVALGIKKINDKEEKFAIKIFKKSFLKKKREYYRNSEGVMKFKDALDNVKREIAIMKKLRHKNVIKLFEVIENPENDKLYMVLEFASGGQIIEWDDDECKFFFCNQTQNEPLTEDYLREIFRGCIKGLFYLHTSGIIHRDIKPQNILLDKNENPKLADFGVSAVAEKGDNLQGNEGTYFFMPPEALNKETAKKGYSGKKADIWALGVTFFAFTFLQLPFYGKNLQEIFKTIQEQELEFPTHRQCSDGLKQLLQMMIEKNPEKRANLIDISKSDWINLNHKDILSTELIENKIVEVNDDELADALQISTVIRIKAWVQRWKANTNARNSIDRSFDSKSPEAKNKNKYSSAEIKGGVSKFADKNQKQDDDDNNNDDNKENNNDKQ